jgi:hypothetical protein
MQRRNCRLLGAQAQSKANFSAAGGKSGCPVRALNMNPNVGEPVSREMVRVVRQRPERFAAAGRRARALAHAQELKCHNFTLCTDDPNSGQTGSNLKLELHVWAAGTLCLCIHQFTSFAV